LNRFEEKPMAEADYKQIRARLEKDRKQLNARLDAMRADRLSEDRRDGSHLGKIEEEAAESADLENLLAQEDRLMDELSDIETAIGKFATGTYGLCEKCGREIVSARLEAIPTARLCIKDAQKQRVYNPAGARRVVAAPVSMAEDSPAFN
jgi:RNA polymerase-binding transcription factor DksA